MPCTFVIDGDDPGAGHRDEGPGMLVRSLCVLEVWGAGTVVVWQGAQLLEPLSDADLGGLLGLEPVGQGMATMATSCGNNGWGLAEVDGAIVSGLRIVEETESGEMRAIDACCVQGEGG